MASSIVFPLAAWGWTSPTPFIPNSSPAPGFEATADWKADYTVAGGLASFKEGASLTAELALTQIGPWTTSPDGAPSSLVGTQNVSFSAGLTPVSFGIFRQDWQWFEQETGTPTGPTVKFVSYLLSITVTDNSTGDTFTVTPEALIVEVSVSRSKISDQGVARTAFINSVALAIAAAVAGSTPFGWAIAAGLAAAAVSAQALSQAEADAAEDPPEPSLAFDRTEPFRPKVLGAPVAPEIGNVQALLECGLRMAEARRVLSVTEGRLEGARRVGGESDVNRQMGHHWRIAAMIGAERGSVERLGSEADREFVEVLERLASPRERRPEEGGEAAEKPEMPPAAGVDIGVLRAFGPVLHHPGISAEVWTDVLGIVRGVSGGMFANLATGIGEAIDNIVADNERLIRTMT
jgi:hypothetical protein